MLKSIDLFSGSGALTLALAGVASPVMYCDTDPASRCLLTARMESGHLPRAPIADDVTTLRGNRVPRADLVVGGFPCTGFSKIGRHEGLQNPASALFYELVRVVRESSASAVFLENVPVVMKSIGPIQEAFAAIGFAMRWCVVGADDVGAPQMRRRWFCIAYSARHSCIHRLSARPLSRHYTPFDWSARPPPRTMRLESAAAVRASRRRWQMLGNGAVPDAARLAFFRILSAGAVTHLCDSVVNFVSERSSDGALHWAAAGHAGVVHAHALADAEPVLLPSAPIKVPTATSRVLIFDPLAVPPPPFRSPRQTTPALQGPTTRKRWATPRHGKATRGARVMTQRCMSDLPTQIVFERETVDRELPANADFGDFLMGLTPSFTKV